MLSTQNSQFNATHHRTGHLNRTISGSDNSALLDPLPMASPLLYGQPHTSAVSPTVIFKFIDDLGKAVTVQGTSLTSIVSALAELTAPQRLNLFVQTMASFSGVIGDANPVAAGVSIGFAAAGVGTGLAALADDKATAAADQAKNGAPTSHDVLLIKSDAVTVVGDGIGVVTGILNLFPPTKLPAVALSVLNAGLTLASVGLLAGDTQTISEVETTLKKYLEELQVSLTKYSNDISSAFGSPGASLVSSLSTLVGAVLALEGSGPTTIINNVAAVSTAVSNSVTAASNIFNTLGVALHNLTESAEGVSASATSSSCTVTSAIDYDQHDAAAAGAYSFQDSANGLYAQGNDDAFSNGTIDQSVSLLSQTGPSASQDTQTNVFGVITAQQTTIDGVTIETGANDPTEVSSNLAGDITYDIPSTGTGDGLIFSLSSAGADQIFAQSGTSPLAEVANYGTDGLDNGTIAVSDPTSGSVRLQTDISSGYTVVVDANKPVSGITQVFNFLSSGGTLELLSPTSFIGTISNLQDNDTIYLPGVEVMSTSISSGGTLYVQNEAGKNFSLILDPSQNYNSVAFVNDGDQIVLEPKAAGTGQQSTTVTASVTNPSTGSLTNYTASVNAQPASVQFAAERTSEYWTQLVPVVFSFTGGNLDPNSSPDQISVSNSGNNDNPEFEVQNGLYGLGPDSLKGTLQLYSDAMNAGVYTDIPVPLTVGYDGASNDITFQVNENIYASAVGSLSIGGSNSGYYAFPILHVGQEASVKVKISNTATGALTDSLSSSAGSAGVFQATNSVNLASGQSSVVTLQAESGAPGNFTSDGGIFNLVSHDAQLPDVRALSNVFLVNAQFYNFAQPVFLNSNPTASATDSIEYPILPASTSGFLTQVGSNAYNLNFGKISTASQIPYLANIVIVNEAPGVAYSDYLAGTINMSGSGFYSEVLTGVQSNTPAGYYIELGDFAPDLASLGQNTMTIAYRPTSVDGGGTTLLPNITLTVTDNVYSSAQGQSAHL